MSAQSAFAMPMRPATSHRFDPPLAEITPERARGLIEELAAFLAAAEPWRPYLERVEGPYYECRECHRSTTRPGRLRWKWRRLLGPASGGQRNRTESLCPDCQRKVGV